MKSLREAAIMGNARAVIHDTCNVLTCISWLTHLMLEATDAEKRAQLAEEVQKSIKKVNTILAHLTQGSSPRRLNINEELKDFFNSFQLFLRPGQTLVLKLEEQPCFLTIDPLSFERCLTNLLLNATQAMENGGTIEIRVENKEQEGLYICVIDQGKGIKPEHLPHLGAIPFTTKSSPTSDRGFGLFSVKNCLQEAGGTLCIQSKPGETQVKMRFVQQPPLILIAEDEPSLAALMKLSLEKEGFEVRCVHDRNTCFALLEQIHDTLLLVILDLGLGFKDEFKATYPNKPVIYTSGYTEHSKDIKPFLLKPFSMQELIKQARHMLTAKKKNVLIILSDYYEKITSLLEEGAKLVLEDNQISYDIIKVLGSLEIPLALSLGIKKSTYDGFIALGCIIQGETLHFDIVAHESARQLTDLSVTHNVPIGNGILTVNTLSQALERADPAKKDRGGWAAKACLNMIKLKEFLEV